VFTTENLCKLITKLGLLTFNIELTKNTIPFAPSRPILGFLPEFKKNRLNLSTHLMETYGDIVQYKLGPHKTVMITHPDYIKHVLQENYNNYKKDYFYEDLKLVLGQGLVTSEGEFWRQQRKLVQPGFHRNQISRFAGIMVDQCDRMLESWSREVTNKFDLVEEMKKLTMSIVSLALFNTDLSHEANKLGIAINDSINFINGKMESFIKLPQWFPTPKSTEFNRNFTIVKNTIMEMIAERRKSPNQTPDLLDMLMAAQDEETGVGMSDQQLFDEIMTLFLAGHETTAHGLVWTIYLLDKYPEMEANLFEELGQFPVAFHPELKDLPDLSYTTATIKESMRMLPPVWGIGREAVHDDLIGGYSIPHGMTVFIPIYQMHYHPEYWTEPEVFNPERFLDEELEKKNRWVYLPFGGGPRQCIGNNFAIMEMQIVVAMIMRQFKLELISAENIQLNPGVTLRPEEAVLMKIKTRNH
jgi:cytochrome P450